MKKLCFVVALLLSSSAFAFNAYLCSLQNLLNPNSCRPDTVYNEQYGCNAMPYIRVDGKPPVCVD